MGKPYTYGQNKVIDDYNRREIWFNSRLKEIDRLVPESIAFPYGIGCGLAGGNWENYYNMLINFASRNPEMKVYLFHKN